MFDVIVIGGGVVGACVLRELTRYALKVCMLEKNSDVATGQSGANSGIVHAGYDAPTGSLKAKFNVLGNRMMKAYAEELGVEYKNIGSLVVAYSEKERDTLETLKLRGEKNGVTGLRIIERDELIALEPNISGRATVALFAPSAGIVCPYGLTIAAVGNAMDNGAALYTDFDVCGAERIKNGFAVRSVRGDVVESKIVINCAGLGSERISKLFGDDSLHTGGRRGEYILLDKKSGNHARHTVFMTPTEKGKGILVTPTVDGNLLLGPTAEVIADCAVDTTQARLAEIMQKAREVFPNVPLGNVITSFAGVRAFDTGGDFVIKKSDRVENLIHVAGIESPGLTAAPAIAGYVVKEIVSTLTELKPNGAFDGRRESSHGFERLSAAEKNAIIKNDPAYGRIVCRCECVTEGEIVKAIRTNPPARTVDGVKRRTRAGMGRCQGGFCQPSVAEIIARELGIPFESVQKSGSGSELVTGRTK